MGCAAGRSLVGVAARVVVGADVADFAELEQPAATSASTIRPPRAFRTFVARDNMASSWVPARRSVQACARRHCGPPDRYAAAVRQHLRILASLAVASTLLLAACGSKSTPSSSDTTTSVAGQSGGHVAIPVGTNPSISAKMICESEVKDELTSLLGVKTTQPLKPTWTDHTYSCTYHYA